MARQKWTDGQFGKHLKAQREHHGWSQPELAGRLKERGIDLMHPTTVAKIEAGTRSVRINEALAFADVFDMSVDALLGRREPDHTTLTFAMVNASSYAAKAQRDLQAPQNTADDVEVTLKEASQRFNAPQIAEMVRLAREVAAHLSTSRRLFERIEALASDVIIESDEEEEQRN